MDPKQTKMVSALMLAVLVAWLSAVLIGADRTGTPRVSQAPLRFDAKQAFQSMEAFVNRHPRRVLGSIEARQSTGYLKQEFERMGYKVDYTHFDAIVAGRRQVGRNVLALKQGQLRDTVAVVAHYDTARTTFQGAMDNGAGIGVLVELARVFSNEAPRHELLLVASDGEEWGMLGALDLARNYSGRDRWVAVLSLDYVALGELKTLRLDTTGQMGGYTPPWLREISRSAAQASGLPVVEPSGFREYIERALLISWTDQGPFLNAGIAGINLGSSSTDYPREQATYHSLQDLLANMRLSSLKTYGETAERIVRTIDELPAVPQQSMGSFRLGKGLYLRPAWITGLQQLIFVPFLAILYFHLANHRKYMNAGRLAREGIELLCATIPLFLAYLSIPIFERLRLIPRYPLYPPPLKDPVLENPGWGVLGGVLATAIITAIILYFLRKGLTRNLPRADYFVSKSVLMAVLLAVIVMALRYNSYWAVTFLALPAWIWGMVGIAKGPAANRIWILAAGAISYAIMAFSAHVLGLGFNFPWYAVLAISNGMFTREGVLLGIAAAGLGVRFLAIQSHAATEAHITSSGIISEEVWDRESRTPAQSTFECLTL